ncbi:MAG: choline/carnitine O-acyltransferase [Proteobacteria bacterium]|nr:choline/carnitine O-acyltransferase [Pseudomonadota bacterium]
MAERVGEAFVFPDIVRQRAVLHPERPALTFLRYRSAEDPLCERLRYSELLHRAQAVAAVLQDRTVRGDRALILTPPGPDYIVGFLACQLAGVVPVPAYPPRASRHVARLVAIAADCAAAAVLAVTSVMQSLTAWGEGRLPECIAIDAIPDNAASAWRDPAVGPADLAFLQYTSGTTGAPKGVMVGHDALMANFAATAARLGLTDADTHVTWLPPYHDLGLIGSLLQPLYFGQHTVAMAPAAFLQEPLRWLRTIAAFRGTTSAAPNFAYELCCGLDVPDTLDLSSWRCAVSGGEPPRARTLERFSERFGPAGFAVEAFCPGYGLAEATLQVAVKPLGRRPRSRRFRAGTGGDTLAVANGQPLDGHMIRVVDPATGVACAPGVPGELWVRGPTVSRGYWGQPEATAAAFGAQLTGEERAGSFLRTGDIGTIVDGEVYVLGRLKELIILRGRNHYAKDLEAEVADSHTSLQADSTIAFGLDDGAAEQLVIVQELTRAALRALDAPALFTAIRQALVEAYEVAPHAIVLVRPGSLPRTSSGKLQRLAARAQFRASTLVAVAEWRESADRAEPAGSPAGDPGIRAQLVSLPRGKRREALLDWLASQVQAVLRLPAPPTPVADFEILGLDSLMALELRQRLDSELSLAQPLPPAVLTERRNIVALASAIEAAIGANCAFPPAATMPALAPPKWDDDVSATLTRLYGGRAPANNWSDVEALYQDFLRGEGAQLQRDLEAFYRANPGTAYHQLYRNAYLRRRERLPFDPAAQVVAAVLRLPDRLAGASVAARSGALAAAVADIVPVAAAYPEGLTTVRRIGRDHDMLVPSRQGSRHIVIFHSGDILELDLAGLTAAATARAVAQVVAQRLSTAAIHNANWLPAATAAAKPDADRLLRVSKADPTLNETITAIESAVCVLVLDPATGGDPAALHTRTLFGNGGDRWHGQHHLVIFASPYLGLLADHAALDGLSGLRLAQAMLTRAETLVAAAESSRSDAAPTSPVAKACDNPETSVPWKAAQADAVPPPPHDPQRPASRLLPAPVGALRDELAAIAARVAADAATLHAAQMVVPGLPHRALPRLPALFAIASSRAGLEALGQEVDVYSSVSLAHFQHGRVTGVRGRPPETASLLRSWPVPAVAPDAGLLEKAIDEWTGLYRSAAAGGEFYTHLVQLAHIAAHTGRDPAFFRQAEIQDLMDWPPLVSSGILSAPVPTWVGFPAPPGGLSVAATLCRNENATDVALQILVMGEADKAPRFLATLGVTLDALARVVIRSDPAEAGRA